MSHWCSHDACIDSVQDFESPVALQIHTLLQHQQAPLWGCSPHGMLLLGAQCTDSRLRCHLSHLQYHMFDLVFKFLRRHWQRQAHAALTRLQKDAVSMSVTELSVYDVALVRYLGHYEETRCSVSTPIHSQFVRLILCLAAR